MDLDIATLILASNAMQEAAATSPHHSSTRRSQHQTKRGTDIPMDEMTNRIIEEAEERGRVAGAQEGIAAAHEVWKHWLDGYLNRSQGENYICRAERVGLGAAN